MPPSVARTSLGVALIGCVLAGLVLAWPVDCLVIRQIDEPDRPVRQVTPLPPGAHFEVAWRHSVEREAWVETFENVEHALVLTATRFKTFGAGVPAHAGRDTRVVDGWVIMSGIDRPVPALAYQAASKRGYRLRIGDGRWQALSRSGQAPLLSFSIEARARAAMDDLARDWFKKLESGDQVARDRWEEIRVVSMTLFEKVYSRLGVSFDKVIGESHYEEAMSGVIDQLQSSGLLEESDGAEVVQVDEDIPPMLIRKKDGATLYGTRDLASAITRHEMVNFDRCLYVVDAGQSLHFRQVFGVLKKLGYEWADRLEHAEFGVMRLNVDGGWKKGKTRGGQVVLLHEVLGIPSFF